MAEPETADEVTPAPVGRARLALIKRLADVVCLPLTRVNAFERAVTGDLLVEMLREASPRDRWRVARRLSGLSEIPNPLVRLLLRDDPAIARPLLEDCDHLADSDLVACIRQSGPEHRRMIAGRRHVSDLVAEALVETHDAAAIDVLLHNHGAKLSPTAVDGIVAASRYHRPYVGQLLRRPELKPSHAYAVFWWADAEQRQAILARFAVSREVLQEAAGDVFQLAAEENWQDPLTRKALQFVERRQRNRGALARSPFGSLEEAIAAGERGMTREIVSEIAYLSGVKPLTAAKILGDASGEPIAVLCKAAGLSREALVSLWRGLKRPEADSDGRRVETLERTLATFDRLATDRAQTVLRYWGWALSSAMSPALMQAIRAGDEDQVDEFSPPQRAAMLVLAEDIRD